LNQPNTLQQRPPTAFISCSLRLEDKSFVDYVERIVVRMGFVPVGTIGRYDAAPKPIWQQMKENIQTADCIVLAATPRYLQQDLSDKLRTGRAMSEMLHTEVAMAVAMDRPVLAFVLEGTDVGSFLPQAVQYITLKRDRSDLLVKWHLIQAYFVNAAAMIQQRQLRENQSGLLKLAVGSLAVFGGITLLNRLGNDDENNDLDDDD
jgi:hypothetical protein